MRVLKIKDPAHIQLPEDVGACLGLKQGDVVVLTLEGHRVILEKRGFLSPFGDMTLWNILASCVVLHYIFPYSCVTTLMLWGHILSVAPETSSMEGGARFHLDTSHHRPGPLVTRCDRT